MRRRYISYSTTSTSPGDSEGRVGKPRSLSKAMRYLGLKPLRKSRKTFIVSARLTVVPQIARISSGSSEGAMAAESCGADEGGRTRAPASEERSLGLYLRALARGARDGVAVSDECMSPRLFFGVA